MSFWERERKGRRRHSRFYGMEWQAGAAQINWYKARHAFATSMSVTGKAGEGLGWG